MIPCVQCSAIPVGMGSFMVVDSNLLPTRAEYTLFKLQYAQFNDISLSGSVASVLPHRCQRKLVNGSESRARVNLKRIFLAEILTGHSIRKPSVPSIFNLDPPSGAVISCRHTNSRPKLVVGQHGTAVSPSHFQLLYQHGDVSSSRTGLGAADLEGEIFEFMSSLGMAGKTPSRQLLEREGRCDLIRAMEQEGGIFTIAWRKDTTLAGNDPVEVTSSQGDSGFSWLEGAKRLLYGRKGDDTTDDWERLALFFGFSPAPAPTEAISSPPRKHRYLSQEDPLPSHSPYGAQRSSSSHHPYHPSLSQPLTHHAWVPKGPPISLFGTGIAAHESVRTQYADPRTLGVSDVWSAALPNEPQEQTDKIYCGWSLEGGSTPASCAN